MPPTHRAMAAVAMVALVIGCGGGARSPAGPPVALRLPALDGGELELVALRGRVVVLHLFDTGVAATIADTTELAALQARHPRRLAVVGIALDQAGYPVVAPWRRALGLRYVIALADPGLREGDSALGRIRVLPTTLILDARGRIAARVERPLRPGEIARLVAPLLD